MRAKTRITFGCVLLTSPPPAGPPSPSSELDEAADEATELTRVDRRTLLVRGLAATIGRRDRERAALRF